MFLQRPGVGQRQTSPQNDPDYDMSKPTAETSIHILTVLNYKNFTLS